MKYGRILVVGGSSGIGLATAEYLADQCEELITISRRPSPVGQWIETDITKPGEIQNLVKEIKDKPIEGLLYLGGTWETHAFTNQYSFEDCSDQDLENVLSVNLLGPMRLQPSNPPWMLLMQLVVVMYGLQKVLIIQPILQIGMM